MKQLLFLLSILFTLEACHYDKGTPINADNQLIGSWEILYADILENDSLTIKDLSNTKLIKIISKSHFAFFNQINGESNGFYGGGGTYTLVGNQYTEKLDFIASTDYRGHSLPFTIQIKADTLLQYGIEELEASDVKRQILEKYIRINH